MKQVQKLVLFLSLSLALVSQVSQADGDSGCKCPGCGCGTGSSSGKPSAPSAGSAAPSPQDGFHGDFSQSCFQNRGALVTVDGHTACKYTIYRNYNGQLNPGQSVDLNSLENGYAYNGGYNGGNYGYGGYSGSGANNGAVFDRVRMYDKIRITSSNGPRVVVAGQDLGQVAADITVQSNAEGTMIVSNDTKSNSFNWSWNLPLIRTVEVTRCLDSDFKTTYPNCP